jgi:hypothetical protein
LTNSDSNDLWPCVDAAAKPRLFYQAHIDTRSDPRLFAAQIGSVLQTDLTTLGGEMPRVSPKNDAVVYVLPNEKTGRRDIYRVSDRGGSAENLTNSNADNTDPAWNGSGNRIAFASDREKDEESKRNNFDIYVLEAGNSTPRQITRNGSVDDMPAFDPPATRSTPQQPRRGVGDLEDRGEVEGRSVNGAIGGSVRGLEAPQHVTRHRSTHHCSIKSFAHHAAPQRLQDRPRSPGLWPFAKRVYAEMNEDDVFMHASAMAYAWIFAVFPFFIFLLTLVPYVPQPSARRSISSSPQRSRTRSPPPLPRRSWRVCATCSTTRRAG